MKVVEIFTRCFRNPVRLTCISGDLFTHSVRVIVGDDDAPDHVPRYRIFMAFITARTDRPVAYPSHKMGSPFASMTKLAPFVI